MDGILHENLTREAKMLGESLTRGESAGVSNIDEKARTAELTFASELPYERWFGTEVLEMSSRAADLKRLNNGGALLSDHGRSAQIGKVVKAWIGDDKRAHAIVKFSRNARGEEEFQDVIDGIRSNVSFGYKIREFVTEKGTGRAPDKVTATRWEALEISLVSVPADPTIGVGRSEDDLGSPEPVEQVNEATRESQEEAEKQVREENTRTMDIPATQGTDQPVVTPPVAVTFAREDQIFEYGRRFGIADTLVRKFAFDPNGSVDALRAEVAKQYQAAPQTSAAPEQTRSSADLDLTDKQVKQYSISRAILAQADGDWSKAGFERECHEAIEQKMDKNKMQRSGSGFLVPTDVQYAQDITNQKRDLSATGGNTSGGYIINQADHMPQSFIDLLRSKAVMLSRAGVRVMSDLVGNPSIPRQNAAASGYWVAEGVAPTESQLTLGQLTLSPKTCGAMTEFTRQLLIQSQPAVDQLVKSDIAEVLARTIDTAIIRGSGTAGQPTGIKNTTGVTEITLSGAGSTFDRSDAIEFESTIAEADAPEGTLWIMRPSAKGILKNRPQIGTTFPVFLVGDDNKLNGYDVVTTTQMLSTDVLFGDFSQVILGEWGILEIEANKYGTSFGHGGIQVRGLHMVDVAVRYPQAICKTTAFA
jgi:HK97 family phage major capsid protein